jgi:hypothetical protein
MVPWALAIYEACGKPELAEQWRAKVPQKASTKE